MLALLAIAGTLLTGLDAAAAGAATTGGVNTGQPGSTCASSDGGLTYSPPGPGVSTTGLGTAPAYYELGAPAAAFAGQPPKGLMIVIHGGGWYVVGPAAVAADRPVADTWRDRGWETLNITYTACAQSMNDVLWFHDAARQLVGSTMPLCVDGQSAGAHLALMMADDRRDVACVVAEGAPTDFATLPLETAYNPVDGLSDQTSGSNWVFNMAVAAFGAGNLTALSPVTSPGAARLLLGTAQQDEFVPWAQAQDLATATRLLDPGAYVDTDQLAAGNFFQFTHTTLSQGTGISKAAYDDYMDRQLRLVAPLVAPAGVTSDVINDIRVPSLGNYAVGDEEFDTTRSGGQTSGSVSGRVDLGPGNSYRIMSCIGYYDPVVAPQGWCNQSSVSTIGSTAPVAFPLPPVSARWQDPAPGTGNGFGYGFTTVSYYSGGSWVSVASSLPDTTLDAGVQIPPS